MHRALRPLFVNVTWGAGGSTAQKSLELAEVCQSQIGLTTCLHLTCTNMSRALIDDALQKARAIGIRNILALRGDPPRSEEYGFTEDGKEGDDSNKDFQWAVDLVRYIKKQHGDYFCVGVAAYPEGHSDQSHPDDQNVQKDLKYLVEKVAAGADFIMTQLFFDIDAYFKTLEMWRNESSGTLKNIPVIPGLMPIQSYQILRRTTNLSHAKLPQSIVDRLEPFRGDDDAIKSKGVDILSEMVEQLKRRSDLSAGPLPFHFYTLNLEKAVARIVERCNLIPEPGIEDDQDDSAIDDIAADMNGDKLSPPLKDVKQRRKSSVNNETRNRVVVETLGTEQGRSYQTMDREAGVPTEGDTRAATLQISEGQGTLGREATWDDFPNGRWGDARSPAYGEIDGYGISLHVSRQKASKLWGAPVDTKDISTIFQRYISGEIDAIPWSEEGFLPETNAIKQQLLTLNGKGWWTVASQPAVNGLRSSDPTFGWGPKGGFVFQKPFVELFLPHKDWIKLRESILDDPNITYFASNASGEFQSSDIESVNPVTWGTFPAKEIVTPTIIEAVSFKAWAEEAFSIWTEWRRIYPPKTATAKLLGEIREDCWLINLICHDFVDGDAIWRVLGAA